MQPVDPMLAELAEEFWRRAGSPTGWPRDIDQAVTLALDVLVVPLRALSLRAVQDWLSVHRVPAGPPCPNRIIHGCLVMLGGAGLIFIDASDAFCDRRFTLAHETAHYLLECAAPRARAIQRFGPSILQVLEGARRATLQESLEGWQAGIATAPRIHLMEQQSNETRREDVWRAENNADALGLELIAPAGDVLALLPPGMKEDGYHAVVPPLQRALMETFGLPAAIAESYARCLAMDLTGGPDLVDALGLRRKNNFCKVSNFVESAGTWA